MPRSWPLSTKAWREDTGLAKTRSANDSRDSMRVDTTTAYCYWHGPGHAPPWFGKAARGACLSMVRAGRECQHPGFGGESDRRSESACLNASQRSSLAGWIRDSIRCDDIGTRTLRSTLATAIPD